MNIRIKLTMFVLTAITLACGLLQPRPDIPDQASAGLDPDTVQRLGHLDLSEWTDDVPDGTLLSLFSGVLSASCSGREEIYAFVTSGDQQIFLGSLNYQFGNDFPVRTLFLDTGGERFIVGYVDPWGAEQYPNDKLLYFRMDRPGPDTNQWMKAVKESEINSRIFLVPIFEDEAAQWDTVVFVGVQTIATLGQGVETDGSYYAVEKSFSPPLHVSDWFICGF